MQTENLTQAIVNHREYLVKFLTQRGCQIHDAEDIAQQALIRGITRQSSFDASRSTLTVWLSNIALRLRIDSHRSRFRKLAVVGNIEAVDYREHAHERIDSKDCIDHLVKNVGERHWRVLRPTLEGASDEHAAAEIGKTGRQLRALKHRAVRAFQAAAGVTPHRVVLRGKRQRYRIAHGLFQADSKAA